MTSSLRRQHPSAKASLYQAEVRGELNGNVRLRGNGALIVSDHAPMRLVPIAFPSITPVRTAGRRIRGNALYAKRAENAIIRTARTPNQTAMPVWGNNITLSPARSFGTATNALPDQNIPILCPYRLRSTAIVVRLPAAGFNAGAVKPTAYGYAITTSTWRRTDATLLLLLAVRHVDGRRFRYLTRNLAKYVQRRSTLNGKPLRVQKQTVLLPLACSAGSRAGWIRVCTDPGRLHPTTLTTSRT